MGPLNPPVSRRRLVLGGLASLGLLGCGGGDAPPTVSTAARLRGEVFGHPSELSLSPLFSNAGYSGDAATLRAIQAAGKAVLIDWLFVLDGSTTGQLRVPADLDQRLDQRLRQDADLLRPGIRLYLCDEWGLGAAQAGAIGAELDRQVDALEQVLVAVRRHLPQAQLGASFSPAASWLDPALDARIDRLLPQLDWVATDPYWYGDPGTLAALSGWTRAFAGRARALNARIETWLVIQAFKDPSWAIEGFRSHVRDQLQQAAAYDADIVFGWQHTSELNPTAAGQALDAETRALYLAPR